MKKKLIAGAMAATILFTGTSSAFAAAGGTTEKHTGKPTQTTTTPIPSKDFQTESWKTKVAAQTLRYAGWFADSLRPIIGNSAANFLKANLGRIADWMGRVDAVQETALVQFLVGLGFDPANSVTIARYIVLVFGL